ncbi:MAG: CCA tRNA nucleotidyltransferase [Acidobacteria bacterium]|nr:CCA tRNA nucleotidyltransferase [Acidobacteriota bacterium]
MDGRTVIAELRRAGHLAYLVGGCVRDRLLGRVVKDEDVATSARPDQVQALFPGSLAVGAHFGVVLVGRVEVATFRSDGAYQDGRHPDEVTFEARPERDASRRDFTINGLFLDPESGEILDFVGGQADLTSCVIRAIGDPAARFQDDHLRLLRAVRFAARFGFEIEPETMRAMRVQAALIQSIAAERVREELTRMLTEGQARRALELLDQAGLLEHVLPEVKAFQGVEQPPDYHPEGDVWTHVMRMIEGLPPGASATLAWGVLLHDVGKPGAFTRTDRIRFNGHVELGVKIARQIGQRLRFSNADLAQVELLVANHMRFGDVARMKESTIKRFLRLERFDEHLELHRLDCESSHRKLENYELMLRRFEEMAPEVLRPARLLTGADLVAAGYAPGPEFKKVLAEIEDAQLDGLLTTHGPALALAKQRLG